MSDILSIYRCADCEEFILQKRIDAISKDGKVPSPAYCRDCQSHYDRHGITVSVNVMATGGETDDNVRRRESGWDITHTTAALRATKVGGKFLINT